MRDFIHFLRHRDLSSTCFARLSDLKIAQDSFQKFEQSLSRSELIRIKRLSGDGAAIRGQGKSFERLYDQWYEKRSLVIFLEKSSDLSRRLRRLYGEREKESAIKAESELMATTIMNEAPVLKKKFSMIRPAPLHNAFVNMKMKEEGFCWQWARGFLHALRKLPLQYFEPVWVTAHEAKINKHNALSIVVRGHSFEEGLVIDGWRDSGDVYWGLVKEDKYPWKAGRLEVDSDN